MSHVDNATRYEMVRKIAEGGFGVVHEARYIGEGGFSKRVALKLLRVEMQDVAEVASRLAACSRLPWKAITPRSRSINAAQSRLPSATNSARAARKVASAASASPIWLSATAWFTSALARS